MIELKYEDVLHDISDAIIHDVYTGFKEDYLVIHSLIRRHRPSSLFEIGTNVAGGLNVLCNSIYKYEPNAKVYSLDLPYETMRLNSKQYPIGENGEDRVGSAARFPYTQLRGDSLEYDFRQNICEGYYVDGEHTELNVFTEVANILTWAKPKIVILHDTDMPEVWSGLFKAYGAFDFDYDLYRVTDTRISYILKAAPSSHADRVKFIRSQK